MKKNFLLLAMCSAMLFGVNSNVNADLVGLNFVETGSEIGAGNLGTDITLATDATGNLNLNTIADPLAMAPSSAGGTVTLMDMGFTGVYNISVDIASTGTAVPVPEVGRGGSGTLSPGGDLFQADEELTVDNVILTFVSGDDVFQFDGFTGVVFGNIGGTEEGVANGLSFDVDGGGRVLTPVNTIPLSDTVVLSGPGISINSVVASFSAVGVPEPSSLAILAMGAIGIAVRRRR